MVACDVEFRLLQVVVSSVGDERVTLALVHWDGTHFRVATNARRIPDGLGQGAKAVRASLRALRSVVRAEVSGRGVLDGVPEGRGGLLYWGPLRRGRTQSSASHFRRLANELDLRIPHVEAGVLVNRSIGTLLSKLGEGLQSSIGQPDRIRVHNVVHGLREYESPLSWRSDQWHHSFPVQLHRDEPEQIVRRVESVLGRIDVSIPLDSRAVVVAAHPESARFVDKLREIAAFVQCSHGDKIRIVGAPAAKGQAPSMRELEACIRRDVA